MKRFLLLAALTAFTCLPTLAQTNQPTTQVASRWAEYLFANRPLVNVASGTRITITDCADTTCVAGGGTVRADLRWTGSAYEIVAAVGVGGGTPGGSDEDVQYNNAGAFGGVTPTPDGAVFSASAGVAVFSLPAVVQNPQTGAAYDIGDCTANRGRLIRRSHTAAMADTIDQAGTGGCTSGWWAHIKNEDAVDALTLTPDAGSICNTATCSATAKLNPGDLAFLISDGTNYTISIARAGVPVGWLVSLDFTTDTAVGDGQFYWLVPPELDGYAVVGVKAQVITAGTTNTTDVQFARCAAAATGNACSGTVADILTTKVTIDSGENSSDTAATPAVVDTTNATLSAGMIVRTDVDAISTTAAKGLSVVLQLRRP